MFSWCLNVVGFILISWTEGTNVIIENTAAFDCYDPVVANEFDQSFYVDLEFCPIFQILSCTKIASYKPSSLKINFQDNSYRKRLKFLNSGQVELAFVNLNDEGTYTCFPRAFGLNEDFNLRRITEITIYVPPQIEVKKITDPLVVGSELSDAAVCIAYKGKPPAKVKWTHDRNLDYTQSIVNNSETPKHTTVKSILQVQPIKLFNQQSFTCTVMHPALPTKEVVVVLLNVTYPPGVPIIRVDNDNTFLTCEADGNPPPTYTWIMPDSALTKVVKRPTVPLVNPYDPFRSNDTYVCTASNGVGQPQSRNITTQTAISVVALSSQASIGTITGAAVGGLVVVAIVIVLAYVFCVKKYRRKDHGPYQQRSSLIDYNTVAYGRPTVHHANDSLHKQRPPTSVRPSLEEKYDCSDDSSSDSDDEGQHDIDLESDLATTLVDPFSNSETGITSKPSTDFRVQRPSTSLSTRQSRPDHQLQIEEDDRKSPVPAPRQSIRYNTPPSDGYSEKLEMAHLRTGMGDYTGQAVYHRPPSAGSQVRQQLPPRAVSPPQYQPKYSDNDHSAYRKGSNNSRPPAEEMVEYAQIRKGRTHLV